MTAISQRTRESQAQNFWWDLGFEGMNGKKKLEIGKIPLVLIMEQVPLWVSQGKFEDQVDIKLEQTREQSLNQ